MSSNESPADVRRRVRWIGWLPHQHGAWAMVLVPGLLGLARAGAAGLLTATQWLLMATWIAGFFAFTAASGALHSTTGRRLRWLPASLIYGAITAGFGVTSLAIGGVAVAWWLVVFAPLLAIGLLLALTRRERTLLGGLVTVAAASLMVAVIAHPDPTTGLDPATAALTALVYGYFAGTVFYVKTMIRERGGRSWLVASLAWHLALIAAAALVTGLDAAWLALYAALAVRAWLLPWLSRRRAIRPLVVGVIEIGFSAWLLVLGLLG